LTRLNIQIPGKSFANQNDVYSHKNPALCEKFNKRTIMNKHSENTKITRIEKRSIEVQAIAPVIEMVSKKIG
jgi:hypothetical protein